MSFQVEPLQPIDLKRNLFPFCIIWTTIPCISWLFPFIGHAAICKSDGVLYQFLGMHINSHDLSFGPPYKYVLLEYMTLPKQQYNTGIDRANQYFSHEFHNLCTNNCHHHVAAALNFMEYLGKRDWTQFSVEWMLVCQSTYVSWWAVLRVYLPFSIFVAIVVCAIVLPIVLT